MKRFFILVLTALIIFSVSPHAFADDYSSLSDEELNSLLNTVRCELLERELNKEEKTILLDIDGLQVFVDGDFFLDKSYLSVHLPIIVVNNSEYDAIVMPDNIYINGWSCNIGSSTNLAKGKKDKLDLVFKIKEESIKEMSDVEDIEFTLLYKTSEDNFFKAKHTDPIYYYFNQ